MDNGIRPRRFAGVAGVVVLAAACAADDATDSSGALRTVVDSAAGVERVVNEGTPPEWELALVSTIGAGAFSEAPGPDEFGRVAGVALSPDGEVFVADGLNWEVRVFGLDGSHLRSFGRRGEGPGEFATIWSIAWTGDRLLALDFGNGRISDFSPSGDYLGQRETFRGISGSGLRLYAVGAEEVYADDFGSEDVARVYRGHGPGGPNGVVVPTLPPPEEFQPWIQCTGGDRISLYAIPFTPSLVQHPGPGGLLYSALSNEYRIAVMRGSDTVRFIERDAEPAPLSDDEWQARTQDYPDFRRENQGLSCEPDLPGKPAAKPILEAMFVAPDGRLWVDVAAADGDWWEVFDPDGTLLARLQAPASRGAPAFGAEHVATMRRDSLDLDYVDIWRIEGRDGR